MNLITRSDKTVPVTAQARVGVAPQQAFDIVEPIDLALVFRGWGPFPGVRGVKNQTGPWNQVGSSRNPDLADGTTATETLTEFTDGHSFAYELTKFTNVLGKFAAGVRGEWTFTPDGAGTMIRWTYEFKPHPGRGLLLRFGLGPLWRRYMQSSLAATVTFVEQSAQTVNRAALDTARS